MRGIDVSYAQGRVDWRAVARDGVGFAMVKASQGRLLKDASVGPFADPRFAENVRGAAAAGLAVGVQFIGRSCDAAGVLRVATAFETAVA